MVRDAASTEVAAACALWSRAEAARTGNVADAAEARDLAAAMTAAVAKPGARLLIGILGGEVVAAVYGVPLRSDPTTAQVAMLAVEPKRWGGGIGTQLLEALTVALKQQGCIQLRMNVDPGNHRARALYERHGWRHLGETERVAPAADPELVYRCTMVRHDGH